MASTQRTGPHHHSQAGPLQTIRSQTTRAVELAEAPWWGDSTDELDWWTSPSLSYWRGLRDGIQLERERQEVEDDRVHRAAVRRALRIVEVAERRERADRGEVTG